MPVMMIGRSEAALQSLLKEQILLHRHMKGRIVHKSESTCGWQLLQQGSIFYRFTPQTVSHAELN